LYTTKSYVSKGEKPNLTQNIRKGKFRSQVKFRVEWGKKEHWNVGKIEGG
jgi:hypothetical protein